MFHEYVMKVDLLLNACAVGVVYSSYGGVGESVKTFAWGNQEELHRGGDICGWPLKEKSDCSKERKKQ